MYALEVLMTHIEITQTSIRLGTLDLELKPMWLELIALAALHTIEQHPTVTLLDVQQLLNWQAKDLTVIKSCLYREHKKWQKILAIPIFSGSLSSAFCLNPALTPVFTEPLEEIRAKLHPQSRLIPKLENPEAEAQANLMLAKLNIETGQLAAALIALTNALNTNASLSLKQEALFYQARTHEFRAEYEFAHQSLAQLKQCIETQSKNQSNLEPRARAWYSIGCARIHLRLGEWQQAKTAYLFAKHFLEKHHYREWGMIFNGLGRVAQNTTTLDEAQKHYEKALAHYHHAEWTWAVQATLNDCGVVFKERYKNHPNNPKARKHLEQAFRYFTLCQQNCEAAHTGDESAVLEINLGWCYRMFEQYDTAQQWLEKAVQLATKAHNLSDLGWAYMEYAELEMQTSGKVAAAEMYSRAYEAFEDGQIDSARDLAKYKLEEMLR
jgi:tetratricopeptide (TPR) repeat protein